MRSILHLLSESMARGECVALVIGGYSLEAYGVSRTTADVDLLVAARELDAVRALLLKAGYEESGSNDICARFVHGNLLLLPVDLLFVSDGTWEKMWPLSEQAIIEGAAVRVPAPAHLISLKLHAMRQNPGRRDQDSGDIVRVLRSRRHDITDPDFRALCEKYGPAGVCDQILAQLNHDP